MSAGLSPETLTHTEAYDGVLICNNSALALEGFTWLCFFFKASSWVVLGGNIYNNESTVRKKTLEMSKGT